MSKFIDRSGQKFNKLTVIRREPSDSSVMWRCLCDCGNETVVKSTNLPNGSVKSCGCLGGKFKDKTGEKYNLLTVIRRSKKNNGLSRVYWDCKCDCGNKTTVSANNLISGCVKSCGCLKKTPPSTTHGLSGTPEYKTWLSMRRRCLYKNQRGYNLYGGRGIKVCDRWINSFENFLEDMGKKPTSSHSIDRVDSNGNYEPSNCRWATSQEQSMNCRSNVYLCVDNEKMIVTEFAKKYGIKPATIYARLKLGWSDDDAVKLPINTRNTRLTS